MLMIILCDFKLYPLGGQLGTIFRAISLDIVVLEALVVVKQFQLLEWPPNFKNLYKFLYIILQCGKLL